MQHFLPADILLPKKDFEKWAVIACDQYTSEPAYWQAVAENVGSAPSALNIMLPEIFLEDESEKRIAKINQTMQEYLAGGVFNEYKDLSLIHIYRKKYALYDHKAVTGEDGGEELKVLQAHMEDIGYTLYSVRGDYKE